MQYEYLQNKKFLKLFDKQKHREQYVKIEVLNFKTETLLAEIEGKTTEGTVNLNGDSNMRRSASCGLIVDPQGIRIQGKENFQQYGHITEIENLISMNKKIRIYTGFTNNLKTLGYYPDYDIIWFPLGVFVIKTASVSQDSQGTKISLTLNDKTSLLNGDLGGTIPAATVFSEQENYNAAGTERIVEKVLLQDIIKHLVVDFGGELPENVLITDVPLSIVRVIKWIGKTNLYLVENDNGEKIFLTKAPIDTTTIKNIFTYGQNIGYTNEAFTYPGTLECNAGETVASVLDKIKNALGNFEWFYNLEGKFIFQEIKNHIDKSLISTINQINEDSYLSNGNFSTSIYTFDNKENIISISNNPQYDNIKNDFMICGTTKTVTGADKPIRYHLVFDKKPEIKKDYRLGFLYNDYKGLQQAAILKEGNYEIIKDNYFNLSLINRDCPFGYGKVLKKSLKPQKYLLKINADISYLFEREDKIWFSLTSTEDIGIFGAPPQDSQKIYSIGINYDYKKDFSVVLDLSSLTLEQTQSINGYYIHAAEEYSSDGSAINKKIENLHINKISLYDEDNIYYNTTAKDKNKYYLYQNLEKNTYEIIKWDNETNVFRIFPEYEVCYFKVNDWRTELYFQGLENENKTFSKNYYAAELNAEWPKIYNFKQTFWSYDQYGPVYQGGTRQDLLLENYEYYLDFIEGSQGGELNLSQFSVDNIGRRVKVDSGKNVNCIFNTPYPNLVLIEAGDGAYEKIIECEKKKQEFIMVSSDIYNNTATGGSQNSAYDRAKELLWTHTQYNESISINTIPIYHIEPNSRITIEDNENYLYGDYMIKSISLPLTPNGSSTITCTKCLEKTI